MLLGQQQVPMRYVISKRVFTNAHRPSRLIVVRGVRGETITLADLGDGFNSPPTCPCIVRADIISDTKCLNGSLSFRRFDHAPFEETSN